MHKTCPVLPWFGQGTLGAVVVVDPGGSAGSLVGTGLSPKPGAHVGCAGNLNEHTHQGTRISRQARPLTG